jgi:hypothetical protein
MTLAEFITQELARHRPSRLLMLDETARTLARTYLAAHPGCLVGDAESPDTALTLIGDTLGSLDKPQAIKLLGHHTRLSSLVLAVSREDRPLGFNDFLSLGMQRLHGPDAEQWCVYGFNLHTYKPVPDWLNAKYWAHPERWKP